MADIYSEFDQICSKHRKYFEFCARKLLDYRFLNDVDDVVQESYLDAWKSRSDYRGKTPEDLKRWIAGIVFRRAAFWYQRTKKIDQKTQGGLDLTCVRDGGGYTVEQLLIRQEQELSLSRALSQLPEHYRKAVTDETERNSKRNHIYRGKQMLRQLVVAGNRSPLQKPVSVSQEALRPHGN